MKRYIFYIIMLFLAIVFLQLGFSEFDIKKQVAILISIQFISIGIFVLFNDNKK